MHCCILQPAVSQTTPRHGCLYWQPGVELHSVCRPLGEGGKEIKMSRNRLLTGVALLAVAVFAVSCAKPPQQEIDQAKAALAAAEQAEASRYAADAYDQAQRAMNAVNAELEAQNVKFALFRSYTKTKQLIVDATNAANAAKEAGIAGKAKAKNEAQAAIDATQASLAAASEAMTALENCRRKPKDFKKDLEMMKGNLDAFTAQMGGIEGAFAREDFFGAKAQAEALKGQVDAMTTELAEVKAKIRC